MKTVPPAHPRVLLVDDNFDGLLVRGLLLEEFGCEVARARDAEQGLALFEKSHFDVVVTDYRMPRMNGLELIVRLRKIDPNARVILISGFVEPMGFNAENTGADAVIVKNSHEAANLTRWVKRLVSRPPVRKPPAPASRGISKVRSNVR